MFKNKLILITLFFLLNTAKINSEILTFRTDLFGADAVSTESSAYCLIKQSSIANEINYVAYPWAVLINQNLLSSVPEIKVENGITVCQHIRYEKIIPILKKMGVKVLFTPHVDKQYTDITVLPFPHIAVNGLSGAGVNKDIWCSFVGAEYTHWTRAQIFKQFATDPRFVLINRGKTWHFYLKDEQLAKFTQQYQDILLRTRFALCPRGTGASTIRFWESLQAGAIPVLIADEMRLPTNFDWEKCVIRVLEKNIDTIPAILESITPSQEESLRANCFLAYENFAKQNLISPIISYHKESC